MTTQELQRLVDSVLQQLPQKNAICRQDATRWVEEMVQRNDFHELDWHVARLKGIGGSESVAGVNLAYMLQGHPPYDVWGDPKQVARLKLMQVPPSLPTPRMQRGNDMENSIARRILQQMDAIIRTDIMDAVRESSGAHPQHPWLVGNPDLIIEAPGGRIVLVDIKAPDEAVQEVKPGYRVQLHHYRLIMRHAGIEPSAMVLANYSWKDHAALFIPVPRDPKLEDAILRGGDALWDAVLQGKTPPSLFDAIPGTSPKAKLDRQTIERLQELERQYVILRQTMAAIEAETKTLAEQIKEENLRLGYDEYAKKLLNNALSLVTITSITKANQEALHNFFEANGLGDKIDECIQYTDELDNEAVMRFLLQQGLDPKQFMVREIDPKQAIAVLESAGIPIQSAIDAGAIQYNLSVRTRTGKKVDISRKQQAEFVAKQAVSAAMDVVYDAPRQSLLSALPPEPDSSIDVEFRKSEIIFRF